MEKLSEGVSYPLLKRAEYLLTRVACGSPVPPLILPPKSLPVLDRERGAPRMENTRRRRTNDTIPFGRRFPHTSYDIPDGAWRLRS